MTEINQLERAKLALKQDPPLRIQFKSLIDGGWRNCASTESSVGHEHRVHPDEAAKLDAVIWEGLHPLDNFAWISNHGIVGTIFGSYQDVKGWHLVATRELSADQYGLVNKSDKGELPAERNAGQEIERIVSERLNGGGLSVADLDAAQQAVDKLMAAPKNEEAQLVADLKELASEMVEYLDISKQTSIGHGSGLHRAARDLLERINPKPVRNSADLPVDTLCMVWSDTDKNETELRYTDGNGDFFAKWFNSPMRICSSEWDNFKVLKQPKPTFWQGGECPVPDWVEVKVWYRDGTIGFDQNRSNHSGWLHNGLAKHAEIIAYQIMGEKDD